MLRKCTALKIFDYIMKRLILLHVRNIPHVLCVNYLQLGGADKAGGSEDFASVTADAP